MVNNDYINSSNQQKQRPLLNSLKHHFPHYFNQQLGAYLNCYKAFIRNLELSIIYDRIRRNKSISIAGARKNKGLLIPTECIELVKMANLRY